MHPLLRDTDDLQIVHSAVCSMESHANNNPYIQPSEVSYESFFSTIANRFHMGGTNVTSWTPPKLPVDLDLELKRIGYTKARMFAVNVPPGFTGNFSKLLTLMETCVPALERLPSELTTLKAVVAAALNGDKLVDNQTGISQLNSLNGIDPTILTALKAMFKPNVVSEVLFGTVYANLNEFSAKYSRLHVLAQQLGKVDYLQITKLANSFEALIKDFHSSSKQGLLNKNMSSTAIHQLSKVTECLATAVTLSAVIQGTMTELVESSKQELVSLDRVISQVSTEAFGWFGNKETK